MPGTRPGMTTYAIDAKSRPSGKSVSSP
ncbi:MAG: hypothetical protein QOG25_534, partial [Acetobacteraceae bacterium]|nr:hypothetical protein [Acetobacteraceae bacterium]